MADAQDAAAPPLDLETHFTARPRPRDITLGRNLDDGLHPTPSRGDVGVEHLSVSRVEPWRT